METLLFLSMLGARTTWRRI